MIPESKIDTPLTPESQAERRSGVVDGLRRAARGLLDRTVGVADIQPKTEPMGEQGYAHILRGKTLGDDRTYTGVFTRVGQSLGTERGESPSADKAEVISEADAVQGTRVFFEEFIQKVDADPDASEAARKSAVEARYLLDNLAYISEADIGEATAGIAAYWEQYLDEYPENRIVVVGHAQKSSEYIADGIVQKLDSGYSDRVISMNELLGEKEFGKSANLVGVKIVLVDDWLSTGRQASVLFAQDVMMPLTAGVYKWPRDIVEAYEASILSHSEINLVVDTLPRVENGLDMLWHSAVNDKNIGVKSYWVKESSDTMTTQFGNDDIDPMALPNVVTGFHSSTDDCFEVPCAAMVKILRDEYGEDAVMPPLTNIQRPYRATKSN